MELASIYLDKTKLDQNNIFTINFLTTESDFNVFFNKNTICYITNLDLNLVLDDETITETENKTHHQKVIELSKLSNELISKSFNNTKFNEVKLINQYPTSINNLSYKLYLTDEIIDAFSYKYEFLDTEENKIKKCKIYDQYQHLKVGMQFQFNDTSTYTVRLVGDKLKKKLEYDAEKLKIDFWAKSLNSILYELDTKSFLFKAPLYNELHYLYKKNNLSPSKKDLLYEYYFNIDTDNHHVICNENKYNSLTSTEKVDVVFIVLKNKKIRAIKNRIFWLPRWNIGGDHTVYLL